jgi:hypothetical protein
MQGREKSRAQENINHSAKKAHTFLSGSKKKIEVDLS